MRAMFLRRYHGLCRMACVCLKASVGPSCVPRSFAANMAATHRACLKATVVRHACLRRTLSR